MTIVQRCSIALPTLFWQLVNLSVFGYGVAFLFYPDDASKLFLSAPNTELVRFMGVQYLLIAAGTNAMMASGSLLSALFQRSSFVISYVEFLLAGIAGIVVLSMEEAPFIKEQRYVFLGLFIAFTSVLALALFCNVGAFCYCTTGCLRRKAPADLEMAPVAKKSVPSSRADIVKAARR
tara:strand:- start:3632 stop:4165 length:534 start_codon:yes stop_codon:yes gene_type:complete